MDLWKHTTTVNILQVSVNVTSSDLSSILEGSLAPLQARWFAFEFGRRSNFFLLFAHAIHWLTTKVRLELTRQALK